MFPVRYGQTYRSYLRCIMSRIVKAIWLYNPPNTIFLIVDISSSNAYIRRGVP
jgi:hypothetical protein